MSDLPTGDTWLKSGRPWSNGIRDDRGSATPQGSDVHEHQYVKVNVFAGTTTESVQGSDRTTGQSS